MTPKFHPFYPLEVSKVIWKSQFLCFVVRINLSSHLHQYPSTETSFFWENRRFFKFHLKKSLFDPQISPILPSRSVKNHIKDPNLCFILPEQTYLGICINIQVQKYHFSEKFGDFWNFSSKIRFLTPKFHPFRPLEDSKVILKT